jgi:DNA-binding MarR family transcriptional regulator
MFVPAWEGGASDGPAQAVQHRGMSSTARSKAKSTTEKGSEESKPDPFHVGHLLRLAQQVHTRRWANEVSPEVTSPQFQLLLVLGSTPNIDQRTATRLARLDRSTGSELIDRLSRNGYIHRQRDRVDRRRYLLELTATGERMLRELHPSARRLHESLLALVSEDLRQPFLEALIQLVESGDAEAQLGAVSRED